MIRLHIDENHPSTTKASVFFVITYDQGEFPEFGTVCLTRLVTTWVQHLTNFIGYDEDLFVLEFVDTPLEVRITRRGTQCDMFFCEVPYMDQLDKPQRIEVLHILRDIDLHDFARQLAKAHAELHERSGPDHDRITAALGALVGLNLPPELKPTQLLPNVLPRITPVTLVPHWDTLQTGPRDTFTPSEIFVTLDLALRHSDVAPLYPPNPQVRDALMLLNECLADLHKFWTEDEYVELMTHGRDSVILQRSRENGQTRLWLQWYLPRADVPLLPEGAVADEPDEEVDPAQGIGDEDDLDKVAVSKLVPNVDALDFTRQYIAVARTLVARLAERRLASDGTRSLARQVDELERIVALVEANTPPSSA